MFVPQAAIKEEDHPEKDQPSGTLLTLSSFLIFEEYIYINFSHIHVYT